MEAATISTNNGWGDSTVLLYSGWYWTPMNQGWSDNSTASTKPVFVLIPVGVRPCFSKASKYELLNSYRWRCLSVMFCSPYTLYLYDSLNNKVNKISMAQLKSIIKSKKSEIRHWIQLVENKQLKSLVLYLSPRLEYLFY